MKVTAIFMALYLLMGSFFPQGDYTQILCLVELGEHFRMHVEEARIAGNEVSFSHFLQIHYLNTQMHQNDHDHDELPFYHINTSSDQIVPPAWEMVKITSPIDQLNRPASAHSLYFREFLASIFHPPLMPATAGSSPLT